MPGGDENRPFDPRLMNQARVALGYPEIPDADLDAFISGLAGAPSAQLAAPVAPVAPITPPPAPPPVAPISPEDAATIAPYLTPEGQRAAGIAPPPPGAHNSAGVDPRMLPSAAPPPLPRVIGGPTTIGQPRPGEVPISAQPAPAAPPAPSAPRPRARRAAEAPPDPNQQTIDRLMSGPVMPEGERTSSPLDQQLARIGEGERLAREAAHAEAVSAAERQDLLIEAQRQEAQLAREREAATNEAQRRYMAAFEEARRSTVNPHRLLGSAGGMIGVAIATALGGLGAALTGGPNRALETIERAIDRDIRGQESNQRNAQANVSNARTFYDMARQQFSDRAAAEHAARSLSWNQVAERAAAQAAQLRDQGAALRARELEAEARQRAQAAAQQAVIAQQDRELAIRREVLEQRKLAGEVTLAERRAAGGGGGRVRPVTAAQRESYNAFLDQGETPERAAELAGLPRGYIPRGRFSGAGTEMPEGVRAIHAVLGELEHLESILPPEGSDIPGVGPVDALLAAAIPSGLEGPAESVGILSPLGQDIRGSVNNLADLVGRLRSGAVIGEAEERRFRRMLGSTNERELRRGIARVRREIQARLGTPGEQAPTAPTTPAAPSAPLPSGVQRR